jgi:lipopolysaccharide/colanic/teichoic acid biosynthesis glycosyltransferase
MGHPIDSHISASSWAKRAFDILGALVGLVLTAIVALPIALLIRRDGPGPVFYSQTRRGLNGKPFQIWKFRTMVTNADALKHLVVNEAQGQIFKNTNDPRITTIGRVLRKTSLDELPQFWNVLKGEMSLVGTRPPTLDEVSRYEPHHYQRLAVRPGITGEWQAHGRSTVTDFDAIVAMDLDYQRKWSLLYDIRLILKTIESVVNRRGAC